MLLLHYIQNGVLPPIFHQNKAVLVIVQTLHLTRSLVLQKLEAQHLQVLSHYLFVS